MNKALLLASLSLVIATVSVAQPIQKNYWTTNTNPTTPDIAALLNPSRVGVGQGSTIWDGVARTNGFCFYLPANSGIVRTISFQTTQEFDAGWARRNAIRLRVYADFGASLSNDDGTTYRTMDVPLGTLVSDAFRFASNAPYLCRRSTALLDVVSGTNDLNVSTVHFRLKAASQFTNGIAIGFWDEQNNKAYTNGYFSVAYEVGTLNPQYHPYRLYVRSYATNSPASSNGVTLTQYNVTGKTGLVAGWAEAWSWILSPADQASGDSQSSNEAFSQMGEIPIIFETGGTAVGFNPQAVGFKTYYDWGSGSAWMSSGKDDLFHNSYAFTNAREWDGYSVGTPHRVLDGYDGISFAIAIQESYRWFIDDTFYFDGLLKITASHVPATTNMLYRSMVITYEK